MTIANGPVTKNSVNSIPEYFFYFRENGAPSNMDANVVIKLPMWLGLLIGSSLRKKVSGHFLLHQFCHFFFYFCYKWNKTFWWSTP